MFQVIEQTRDEKIAMYMKLTKREIVGMLLNNRAAVSLFQKQQVVSWRTLRAKPCWQTIYASH